MIGTPVSSHPFLSDEWIEAARAVHLEYQGRLPPPPLPVRANVVVTAVPHGPGRLEGHLDTTGGQLTVEHGHLPAPDLTVTVDYATARAAFVNQDLQQLMQSFLSGKILVEGDVTKLLALQAPPADPEGAALAAEVGRRIRDITADA
jgi:hypothetical protein